MDLEMIGARIRTERRSLGLTQQELAVRAHVSRPTIARLETGRATDLGFKPLLRILNSVGLDVRLTDLNRGRPTLDDLLAERTAERASERDRA